MRDESMESGQNLSIASKQRLVKDKIPVDSGELARE